MTDRQYFQHIANIDAAYWMITVEQDKLKNIGALSPIERMVDKMTRHNPYLGIYKNLSIILKDMIKSKKALEFDTSNNEDMLYKVEQYLKENAPPNKTSRESNKGHNKT